MKRNHLNQALALSAAALFLQPIGAKGRPGGGELLLLNGVVKTPSGWAQAVVVRDGIIAAVGDSAALRAMVTPHATVVDLAGATLLPGLFDSHVHPLFAGMEQFACRLAPAASMEAVAATVRACAAQHKPGEWIQGGNWVAAAFQPGQQTRAVLDRAAPNNPVLLNDEAHHSIWVNSQALKLAGIARDTPNPTGGIIERGKNGEATGLLRESATHLVTLTIPPASMEARRRALILAGNQMLSFGITSFTVASVRMADIGPLSALSWRRTHQTARSRLHRVGTWTRRRQHHGRYPDCRPCRLCPPSIQPRLRESLRRRRAHRKPHRRHAAALRGFRDSGR